MKTLKKLAPHAVILIGNMYYIFWGIDRVNKAMNFIDNGYTKLLLILLIDLCFVNAYTLFPVLADKLGRTENPTPVFVRLGTLAVNVLLAVIMLLLLVVDVFNEKLLLFLSEFVKVLILLLCITGQLTSLQITARDRAHIRAMNRRAAQRRPAPQARPAQNGYGRTAPQARPAQNSYGRTAPQPRPAQNNYGRTAPQPRPAQNGYGRTAPQARPTQNGYGRTAPQARPAQNGYGRTASGGYDRRPSSRIPEQSRSRYENAGRR